VETLRQMQEPEPLADGSGFPVMLGPFAVGVSGDEGPQTVKTRRPCRGTGADGWPNERQC
jgi:hypothetical protein